MSSTQVTRTFFIAGDASYELATMQDQVIDGVSPVARIAKETLAQIKQFVGDTNAVYLPSHDPKSVERLTEAQS